MNTAIFSFTFIISHSPLSLSLSLSLSLLILHHISTITLFSHTISLPISCSHFHSPPLSSSHLLTSAHICSHSAMQIQFIMVATHCTRQLFVGECNYPKSYALWIGSYAWIFLIMFANFYRKAYNAKPSVKNSTNGRLANGVKTNGHANGNGHHSAAAKTNGHIKVN